MGVEVPMFYRTDESAYLKIWRHPIEGHCYAAAADTAEGKDMAELGAERADPDFSVCVIREAHTGEECARLRCREPEHIFAQMVFLLLRFYGSPFFVPEVKGGYGRAMLNKLLELGYEPEYIFNKHLSGELMGQPPYRGAVGYLDLGWNTGETNRNLMI